ncbi:TFIIB-type zinc ribbon-containing protein [Paraburkholderia dilworthii]|uniref:TFIIB-type zinc ribbon-containing protein n=1 Tax=Paraburkholderia dilworthii TaxID=948106 RepID=UPI000401890F|nr:zf-TFIIB domain-containing protein [Paraburkholderia dilworthii]
MKCPVCKTSDLLMTERRSIEIDYCPDCRGVWLDRGELDKLIAQDAAETGVHSATRANRDDRRDRDHAYDNNRRHEDDRSGYRTHKKKRSIFDVFDFD